MNDKQIFDRHFNALYKEVFNEVSNETGLKAAAEKFKGTQKNYLENLDKYFHSKCTKEFSWIEKNSTFKEGKVEPKEGISKEEFELKSNELHKCISKNDKGLTSAVVDFENEFNDFNGNITNALTECAKKKDDNDIKACIRDKLIVGSNNLMKVFAKHEKVFQEVNQNIKL